MVFREVSVIEIREALRAWLAGKSERAVAAQAGVDRKTSRRYVRAAVAAGLSRGGGEEQLTDELIGQVVSVVRPVRPDGHGQGWAELEARQEEIAAWVKAGVPVVKIGILLARQGVMVAERTLHRFAAARCGAGGSTVTTPVDDGPPGGELQVDFGYLGLIPAGEGRRRKLHALVFTACFSRFMFVYLTFSMTLEEVIAGCEEAWAFFGGVFRVVVPENVPRNIFRVLCPASLCGRMAACPASTVIDGAWRRHGRRITPSSLQEAHSGACGGRRRGDAGGLLRQARIGRPDPGVVDRRGDRALRGLAGRRTAMAAGASAAGAAAGGVRGVRAPGRRPAAG